MSILRLLVAESEPADDRAERRDSVGKSSGETYEDALRRIAPGATIDRVQPIERRETSVAIADYDAVFLTGSPLHLYHDTAENRRVVDFMRAVFETGVPAFGSCAGLQIGTVAAGGTVRAMPRRPEAAFARRITPTEAGAAHPMLAGRSRAFDAISIHSDEVATLPDGATLLARNDATIVQAAEIRFGRGILWGVQYHPELTLAEAAGALSRQGDDLVEAGLVPDLATLADHVGLVEALAERPDDPSLAWRLGLDRQVTDPDLRQLEIANFVAVLVRPHAAGRGRG